MNGMNAVSKKIKQRRINENVVDVKDKETNAKKQGRGGESGKKEY